MNKYLQIDLQLFADGSRTEKATPRKRQEARKKGQVFQSREVASAVVLIAVFLGLRIFGGYIGNVIAGFYKSAFTEYMQTESLFTIEMQSKLMTETFIVFIKAMAPVFIIALAASMTAGLGQVGFLFTTETLGFKLDRINPLQGIKRVFSSHSVVELLKSIFKITVVVYIAYRYLQGEAVNAMNLAGREPGGIIAYIANVSLNVAIRICLALIILGLFDYGYQWWQYEKNLRMSKQEIKEEFKQLEGNPEIKSKIRQKQRQMSMRRMIQEVPKADVIITNPTHYAVALKYDPDESDAPVVIAKGQDFVALRIREVARQNNVEIVENRELARTLYETVEVGEAIPPELYQAVAEVLAFVYSIRNQGRVG